MLRSRLRDVVRISIKEYRCFDFLNFVISIFVEKKKNRSIISYSTLLTIYVRKILFLLVIRKYKFDLIFSIKVILRISKKKKGNSDACFLTKSISYLLL